jgi:hypothetical protein
LFPSPDLHLGQENGVFAGAVMGDRETLQGVNAIETDKESIVTWAQVGREG